MKGFVAFATVLLACSVQAAQKWPHLRTTYGKWTPQPRTNEELSAAGWTLESTCGDNPHFVGNRWVDDDLSLVVITDVNGYVAGAQSLLPVSAVDLEAEYIKGNPWYNPTVIRGQDYMAITAYFVDPSTICTSGRTQAEFDEQGTGYMLALQHGETWEDLMNIPELASDLPDPAEFWYEHKCFPNMGTHYFNFNYDPAQTCAQLTPFQFLYKNGVLNAVVFQHIGDYYPSRMELVDETAINGVTYVAPDCIYDYAISPGIHAMHTYFSDYEVTC